MNHPVLVIWFKELLDTLRDRRTLIAMIIAPMLVTPLLVVLPQPGQAVTLGENDRRPSACRPWRRKQCPDDHSSPMQKQLSATGVIRPLQSRRNPATQNRHIPATWSGAEGHLEGPARRAASRVLPAGAALRTSGRATRAGRR